VITEEGGVRGNKKSMKKRESNEEDDGMEESIYAEGR
jgi:hypothetical protein